MNRDLLRYEPKLTCRAQWPCETRASKLKGFSTPGALRLSGLGVISLKLKMGKLERMKGKTLHGQQRKRFWKKMMIQKPFSYECFVKSKRARKPKSFKVCIYRNIIETLLCLAMHLYLSISMKITLKKNLVSWLVMKKPLNFDWNVISYKFTNN